MRNIISVQWRESGVQANIDFEIMSVERECVAASVNTSAKCAKLINLAGGEYVILLSNLLVMLHCGL